MMDHEAKKARRKQMEEDMLVVFRHFNLSEEAKEIAIIAAVRHTPEASACYRAIVNSLRSTYEV